MDKCPSCSGENLIDKGTLPAFTPQTFGGIKTSVEFEAGHWLWCPECDIHFRHPCPDQDVLTGLYSGLPASTWRCPGGRAVWRDVENLLKDYSPNNTVLDAGCFCGDFLNSLSGDWRKLGIEPNITARQIALTQNIELVGDAIDRIQTPVESIGTVVLLDVLEHMREPLQVLQTLGRLLVRGGSVIIFTGATDTLAWRLFGRYYWYSALPEHVTFFSLRWFQWAARTLGMRIRWHRYLSSEPSRKDLWFMQFAKLSLYTLVQRLREFGVPERIFSTVPLIRKIANWRSVPWWQAARDHILVVLSS